MDVVGSDGDKVGDITEVNADHFVVKKGFFFPNDYYIPTQAVASVDQDKVYLNVTKEEAMSQDPSWAQRPAATTTQSTGYVDDTAATPSTDAFGYADDKVAGMDTNSGDLKSDPAPFEHEQNSSKTHINENDSLRVPLAAEESTATKRSVDRGSVNVEKNVVSEERTLDVPTTEEEVHVQRRTVDRPVAAGDDVFTGGTIKVPVRGEEVDVQKTAHVVEEIEIDKQAVQDTKHVSGTVRREEVNVDNLQKNTTNSGNTPSQGDERLLNKAQDAVKSKRKPRNSR